MRMTTLLTAAPALVEPRLPVSVQCRQPPPVPRSVMHREIDRARGYTKMTKAFLIAIALILWTDFAQAQTADKIEVYEYGTYTSPPGVDVDVTRHGVVISDLDYTDLVEQTRTIVAQVGVQFGFRYHLLGKPLGTFVPITVVVRYPSPGIVSPGNPVPFVVDDYSAPAILGTNLFYTWTFDDRSEIVPGIWTIEIWYGDKKLGEEKFNVVLPPIAQLDMQLEPGG